MRERERQGMSMRELARRAEITPGHLSKIERGLANPSVGLLWTVSDALGVQVSSMFAEEAAEPASLPVRTGMSLVDAPRCPGPVGHAGFSHQLSTIGIERPSGQLGWSSNV